MRQCNQQARVRKPASKPRRPDAAAPGCASSVFLTLPSLSTKVPIRSVTQEGSAQWIQAATFCAALVGDDELVINNKTTARDIVSQALSAWASRHCADINLLDSFSLTVSFDPDAFGLDHDIASRSVTGKQSANDFYIGIESQECTPSIYVKRKLDALENDYPGLARSVVSYAEQAGYRTFTAFTPNLGLYQGSHLYWYGAESDEEYKETKEDVGDDDEDGEETFLPSEYIAAFPAYFFAGDILDRDALLRIAAGNNEAAEVARVVLSIMDLLEQDACFPSLENFHCDNAYFACYMDLDREPGMFGRVLDDFYENTSNGGDFTAMYGVATIPFNIESFLKWRDEMEKGFALYSKLDRLMVLINE